MQTMHAYEKIQTDIAIICFHSKLKKYIDYSVSYKCIGSVMVSLLVSSALDCGFEPWSGQTKAKIMKLIFVASLLSIQH